MKPICSLLLLLMIALDFGCSSSHAKDPNPAVFSSQKAIPANVRSAKSQVAHALPTADSKSPYRVIDLGAASPSLATSINDNGDVVGEAKSTKPNDPGNSWSTRLTDAFLWHNGKLTVIGRLPPTPVEDFTTSVAYAVNQHGVVVGSSGSFGPVSMSGLEASRAFIYDRRGIRELPAELMFQAFSVNAHDTIVGGGWFRGIVWIAGKQLEIPPLSTHEEGNGTVGVAVNADDEVVGATTVGSSDVAPAIHAFLWKQPGAGRLIDLGTIVGFRDSIATAISDEGTIVGFTSRPNLADAARGKFIGHRNPQTLDFGLVSRTGHAFIYAHGDLRDLGVLANNPNSAAFGINRQGIIVGTSGEHAVVWAHDKITDLNSQIPKNSGWTLVEARAINNHGWIVGWGKRDGQNRAFVLIPRSARP